MGNVNLRALEVYEELEKDYEKLVEKADKLKIEKEKVRTILLNNGVAPERRAGTLTIEEWLKLTGNFSGIL